MSNGGRSGATGLRLTRAAAAAVTLIVTLHAAGAEAGATEAQDGTTILTTHGFWRCYTYWKPVIIDPASEAKPGRGIHLHIAQIHCMTNNVLPASQSSERMIRCLSRARFFLIHRCEHYRLICSHSCKAKPRRCS